MAKSPQTPGAGVNPVYMMIGLGIGVALIIAIVIAATERSTGDVVSAGPETEVVEPEEDADGDTAVSEPSEAATEDDGGEPAEIDGATALDEAADDTAVVPMSDGEKAIPEGEGETPAGEEPAQDLDGSAVDPDDTEGLTTPTGEGAEEGADVGPVPGEDDESTASEGATEEEESDLDTSTVVDPDGGQEDEPDGGAEPFNPTPSGPAGSDGDALTND